MGTWGQGFDLLSGSKVTKTQAVVPGLHSFISTRSTTGISLPFFEKDEGVSVSLGEEENHDAFIAAQGYEMEC